MKRKATKADEEVAHVPGCHAFSFARWLLHTVRERVIVDDDDDGGGDYRCPHCAGRIG